MEIILSVIGTLLVCYFLYRVDNRNRTEDGDGNGTLSEDASETPRQRSDSSDVRSEEKCKALCIETLRKLNCEVEIDERDGLLDFSYQGGHFKIICGNGFIRIWYMFWHDIDLDDIDLLSKARRIINEMNLDVPAPCISYVINEEQHKMYIHSSMDTLFIKEIPEIEYFLISRFDSFFHKAYDFNSRIVQKEGVKAGNNAKE